MTELIFAEAVHISAAGTFAEMVISLGKGAAALFLFAA